MRRTALKPSRYKLKKGLIRRRSKKREAEYSGKDGRRVFVERLLAEMPLCWIRKACSSFGPAPSVDVHEKIPRSAMGAIVPGQKATMQGQVFFAVCRACHDYIHLHNRWAKEAGWLI